MGHEQGLVTSLSHNGWAQVITERRDACGDCSASHCCASLESSGKISIKALNRAGAKAGDLVTISLHSLTVFKSAALFYLIPLLFLLTGTIAGARLNQVLSMSETGGAITLGFAGLFLGFLIARFITRWMSANNQLTPVITEIICPGMTAPESLKIIDPVCRMVVEPAKDSPSFVYKDKTYYFCHDSCMETFMNDPEKYLKI
jgi:sigma-E factor negative regulatory protein RseC